MKNEEEIVKEFRIKLKDLMDFSKAFWAETKWSGQGEPSYQIRSKVEAFQQEVTQRVNKLKELLNAQLLIDKAIGRILEEIRQRIQTIVRKEISFTETETKIAQSLDIILKYRTPSVIDGQTRTIENLELSEVEFDKIRKRALELMEHLVKAAEDLEK